MGRWIPFLILLVSLLPSTRGEAEPVGEIAGRLTAGELAPEQVDDPHWDPGGCDTCHRTTRPQSAGDLRMQGDTLCLACHRKVSPHDFLHPVGIAVGSGMRKRMDPRFRDSLGDDGRLTCTTCHEVSLQCVGDLRVHKGLNPLFFRGGPWRDRTDICFRCHDPRGWQRRSAHDQVDDDGRIREKSCLICHADLEGLEEASSIEEVTFHVRQGLERICLSCHPWSPHPSGGFSFLPGGEPDHLTVPPPEIRERLEQRSRERGVYMPLDPWTGRVFCATCHNPHEKGVITNNPAAAKGADARYRLRISGICTSCHRK